MTRTVGHRDRTELIRDPAKALRRGRALDGMLASLRAPWPQGVTRATHPGHERGRRRAPARSRAPAQWGRAEKAPMDADSLVDLLRRFQAEGVQYILVGGQAVRLNGFVRATEHIDSQPHVRTVTVEGVDIRTLDIEGLLKTKTDYLGKDRIDREVPERLRAQL